jgi:hypothetical protein
MQVLQDLKFQGEIFWNFRITTIHAIAGINVRYLGLVHNLVKDARTKELMRIEMVARATKDILRAVMRRHPPDETHAAVLEQLNMLLGESPRSRLYWQSAVRCKLAAKFGNHCSDVTNVVDVIGSTRSSTQFKRALVSRLEMHVGIRLRMVPDSELAVSPQPFAIADMLEIVPLVDSLIRLETSVLALWHAKNFVAQRDVTSDAIREDHVAKLRSFNSWHQKLNDDGVVAASAHLLVVQALTRCGQVERGAQMLIEFLQKSAKLQLEAYLSVRLRIGLLLQAIGQHKQGRPYFLPNADYVAISCA